LHPCFWYNQAEKYQAAHPDHQFVLLDEYSTAKLTITDLNQMCDSTYQYPVKGGTPVTLKNAIVLLCGNKPPTEVYTTESNWPLINARFNLICLD